MAQIFGAILLIIAIMLAVKVAIILLFLAGLIFRPKETISLLVFLGALALLEAYPMPTLAALGVILAIALYQKRRERRGAISVDRPPELPDDSAG